MMRLFFVAAFLFLALIPASAHAGQDPLSPASKAQSLDLVFLPFSGWFEHIAPQIDAWGKCAAAELEANDRYADRMQKVVANLKQDVVRLLPTAEEGAKLYQLEIEYNRRFWAHRGYMMGLAKGLKISLEDAANARAEDCIRLYLD